MSAALKPAPEYRVVETQRADALFAQPPGTPRWQKIIGELLTGNAVFVPGMTRLDVESLRSIIGYHKYGILRSKQAREDDVAGRLLRLDRRAA